MLFSDHIYYRGTHQFDLFCTSTHRSLLRHKLYFDLNLTSTFCPNFTCLHTCTSRPIKSPYLTKCRSPEVEVERSKYRKGRRYENGRITEKVELMRTLLQAIQAIFLAIIGYIYRPLQVNTKNCVKTLCQKIVRYVYYMSYNPENINAAIAMTIIHHRLFAIGIFPTQKNLFVLYGRSLPDPGTRRIDAVFRRVQSSVQNLTPKIIFSNDELHIILKRQQCRNLHCNLLSISIIEHKYVLWDIENLVFYCQLEMF